MTKKKGDSYEDKLMLLEGILSKLKSDNLTISESIALVREGNLYYKECNELLGGLKEELEVFLK